MNQTQYLMDLAREAFPGGVLGRHKFDLPGGHIPKTGLGGRLYDTNGNSFVDYSIGGGSLILGYNHPTIIRAIKKQADEATQFISIVNEPAILLGKKITEVISWADKVRFTASGADAVMFALRIARAFTKREKIIKFDGAYHGNSDYTLWNLSNPSINQHQGEPSSAGIPNAIKQLVLIGEYNNLQHTRNIVKENPGEIAAIILEPVQRFYRASDEFLSGLRKLCDEENILLVFDEIVTGFRHALGGAAEAYGVEPDLGAFGKAIGGGIPLGAVAGRESMMDFANPDRSLSDGYTYVTSSQAGNPLCTSVSLATLEELSKPGVYENMFEKIDNLKREAAKIIEQKSVDAQVVGDGPLWDIAFTKGQIFNNATANKADQKRLKLFHQNLVKNGVMVRIGGRSYFSTAHNEEDIEMTLKAIYNSL